MLTSHSDAYISRSGDFRGDDDRRQTKPIALPLAHARGVIKKKKKKSAEAAQGFDDPVPVCLYMYVYLVLYSGLGRDRMASMATFCVDFKTSPFLMNIDARFFSTETTIKHGFLSRGTFIVTTWLQHR